jgi:hypothetical protein
MEKTPREEILEKCDPVELIVRDERRFMHSLAQFSSLYDPELGKDQVI